MNVKECIALRRSVRKYKDEPIAREVIEELLALGTKAATGSGMQPWGFVVLEDAEKIHDLSEETRQYVLNNLASYPYLAPYKEWLEKQSYCVFNHARTMILVYGDTASHWYRYDCTLAAANIMLAARSMNIGTCWIGFAEHTLDTVAFKRSHNVPEHFSLVCPMTLGYCTTTLPAAERKAPVVFNW